MYASAAARASATMLPMSILLLLHLAAAIAYS
jgi:hypothetical protein